MALPQGQEFVLFARFGLLLMSWSDGLNTRYLFFTGKGGVGKTSLASATALGLAQSGKQVLLLSTDPASNLDEVFGSALSPQPQQVAQDVTQGRLWVANLDPEAAAAAYREKAVGPYRGKLPPAVLRNMEEQFSGACTTELAAFDQFVELLASPELVYDHIVFDTAPTGHTLRLLSLPGAWSEYLETTTAESSCLGPLAALQEKREQYSLALSRLSDPALTTIALVARPDKSSLHEAERSAEELSGLGLKHFHLLVNGCLSQSSASSDPIAESLLRGQEQALAELKGPLRQGPRHDIPLLSINTVGVPALQRLLHPELQSPLPVQLPALPGGLETLGHLVEELGSQPPAVILTMGKGGVGKTQIALELAQRLAQSGARVRLTTTDPAGDLLERIRPHPNLRVDRIDPHQEVERYRREVVGKASTQLDAQGLDLLREDLRSPCTEEIAVFRAFAEAVQPGESDFVIIDTAPTGHTILLMDASLAYHREVSRTGEHAPEAVRQLLPRLRDANYTKVVLVTLAEPTPLHEARSLQADLKRAGISTYAWVVNRSLLASQTQDPLLGARALQESACLEELLSWGERVSILPYQLSPTSPVGV